MRRTLSPEPSLAPDKKRCFKCLLVLPRTDFYRHSQMDDGLLGKCKQCTKNDVRTAYRKDLEKSRQESRDRNRKHQYPDRRASYTKKYRATHPEKAHAHYAVANAIRTGHIKKQPCSVCGATARIEAHHDDYSKPLDVIWLCSVHHKERHKKLEIAAEYE